MKPGKWFTRTRLTIILGILALAVLGAALVLRRPTPAPITHINVPLTLYPTIPPSAPTYTIIIHSVGASPINGTAKFEDVSGAVAILLRVDGMSNDEENEALVPSEVHFGSCAKPGALAYKLGPPDAGQSETDLSISLKEFDTKRPMAVLLYSSPQDRTVVACGDVP